MRCHHRREGHSSFPDPVFAAVRGYVATRTDEVVSIRLSPPEIGAGRARLQTRLACVNSCAWFFSKKIFLGLFPHNRALTRTSNPPRQAPLTSASAVMADTSKLDDVRARASPARRATVPFLPSFPFPRVTTTLC